MKTIKHLTLLVISLSLFAFSLKAQPTVTFTVDMNSLPSISPDGVFLAGTFNDWANEPMIDAEGDGTYTLVKTISPGTYQYKFKNGHGGWEGIVVDHPGLPGDCTTGEYYDRVLEVGNNSINIEVCFNYCVDCDEVNGLYGDDEYFETPIENPFIPNMEPGDNYVTLADIDGDGDLDMFYINRSYASPCLHALAFRYYKNIGDAECPQFIYKPDETFGLPTDIVEIVFVDMDADGDLDAISSQVCWVSEHFYYENSGTPSNPDFPSTPTQVLDIPTDVFFSTFTFGDLDNDGDYDAFFNGLQNPTFKYMENIGTPTQFEFTPAIINPFGLSIPMNNSADHSEFVDWDCDGDLDILNSHAIAGSSTWYLYENDGTPTAPSFLDVKKVSHHPMDGIMALGDMDGDGDKDFFYQRYYAKNISENGCVSFPTASFTTSGADMSVNFINESSGQETDCHEIQYFWDFGDGNTSTEAAPAYTYTQDGLYNVCLIVEDIAGTDTLCVELAIPYTGTATSDMGLDNSISLFPNPASEILTVKMTPESFPQPVTVKVYDAFGQLIRQFELDPPVLANKLHIDISGLAPGLYTLKIGNERQFVGKSFLKIE